MTNQPDLFGWQDAAAADLEAKRLARRSDPVTSHEGAVEVLASLGDMHRQALTHIRHSPGCTARELEQVAGWDVHKRLKELESKQLIRRGSTRKCTVTGRSAAVWYITKRD